MLQYRFVTFIFPSLKKRYQTLTTASSTCFTLSRTICKYKQLEDVVFKIVRNSFSSLQILFASIIFPPDLRMKLFKKLQESLLKA